MLTARNNSRNPTNFALSLALLNHRTTHQQHRRTQPRPLHRSALPNRILVLNLNPLVRNPQALPRKSPLQTQLQQQQQLSNNLFRPLRNRLPRQRRLLWSHREIPSFSRKQWKRIGTEQFAAFTVTVSIYVYLVYQYRSRELCGSANLRRIF